MELKRKYLLYIGESESVGLELGEMGKRGTCRAKAEKQLGRNLPSEGPWDGFMPMESKGSQC